MYFKNCFFQPWILQTFAMAKLGHGLLGGGHGPLISPLVCIRHWRQGGVVQRRLSESD